MENIHKKLKNIIESKLNEKKKSKKKKKQRLSEKEGDKEFLNELNSDNDGLIDQLTTQPTYIENGTLRDYQLEGLNWLIRVQETGLNAILAVMWLYLI